MCLAVWGVLWDSRLATAVVVQCMGREVVGSLGCGWVGLGVGKGVFPWLHYYWFRKQHNTDGIISCS